MEVLYCRICPLTLVGGAGIQPRLNIHSLEWSRVGGRSPVSLQRQLSSECPQPGGPSALPAGCFVDQSHFLELTKGTCLKASNASVRTALMESRRRGAGEEAQG